MAFGIPATLCMIGAPITFIIYMLGLFPSAPIKSTKLSYALRGLKVVTVTGKRYARKARTEEVSLLSAGPYRE